MAGRLQEPIASFDESSLFFVSLWKFEVEKTVAFLVFTIQINGTDNYMAPEHAS